MLLTHWLRSISSFLRPSHRPLHKRRVRSRYGNHAILNHQRRPVTVEELEDRTLLTSMISVNDVSEWEGDSWNIKTNFIFTVTRTGMTPGDLNQELIIDFTTQDSTATLYGDDYISKSGSILFSADAMSTSQSKTIMIQVVQDGEVETDEYFEVSLSTNNGNVIFDKNIGRGTILDDDIMVLDQADRIAPPESATIGDHFGNAIAIDGDFMVVGAIESDLIATDAGAVYVYFRNRQNTPDNDFDDIWEYQTTLTAFDAAENDQFGCSVAIDGDTIVIGAYQDNGREYRSGTAYVYRWDGNDWNFEDKLIASDGRFNDKFGGDVTIENDVIVVGAAEKNPTIPNAPYYIADAGVAYVFTRTGSEWSETQIITAPNMDTSDEFGWSVELENDTLFISGLKSDFQGSTVDQGAVFVYRNINGVWTLQQTLGVPDGETDDLFGFDLDVDGDILGVISGSRDAGQRKAYVFEYVDGTWQYSYNLGTPGIGNNPSANSISVSGNSIAIGSILSDGYRNETGIVNIYHRKPGGNYWSFSESIFADYGYTDDYFGYAVVYTDSQLIIGTPQAPDSTRNAGQLYIFEPHRSEVSFELSFQGTRENVSGQTTVRLYVTRSSDRGVGALNSDVTVYYHTVDGTATAADGDYQEQSGSITFTGDPHAGSQLEYITIYVNDDDKLEGYEEFYVQLTDDTGDFRFYFDRAEILIFDNDFAKVSVENVTVDEDAGMALVNVTLDNSVDTNVSVDFSTSEISALESSDYTPTSGTLVFEPGVLTKTVAIPLINTDEIEGDETFALNLSNLQVSGAHVQIGTSTGIITIKDDDEANLFVEDLTVDEDTGTASVVVTLDHPVSLPVTVDYATADASATASNDYLSTSGTLSFAAGEQSKTIQIPIVDDTNLVELTESFLVLFGNLKSGGLNVSLNTSQIEVTILDDDQARLSISDLTVNENAGTATVQVSLDRMVDTTISIDYATVDQTATSSDDYLVQAGTITFNPGEHVQTIVIPITDSDVVETDEKFLINLTNLNTNGADVVVFDDQAEVTISDDDQLQGSITNVTVDESAEYATISVSLEYAVGFPVTIYFESENVTAVSDPDYISQSGSLTFNPGDLTKSISIAILNDNLVESDETFFVKLTSIESNGSNIIFEIDRAEITIQDDDQAQISIDDLTVDEDAGSATITVSLVQPVDTAITVDYTTLDQSANSVVDYISQSGTLTFSAGEQSKTITIPLVDSDLLELTESFLVQLNNIQAAARNVIFANDHAEVTILDDDQASISISDISVNEDAGTAVLTVVLSNPADAAFSVDFSTADNSAVDQQDYTAVSGTLIFNTGEQSKTITIPIINSDLVESDETFLVNLSNILSGSYDIVFADNQAEVTIIDDDQAQVTINDISVNEAAGTATLTVSLDHAVDQSVSLDFQTSEVTASSPEDFVTQMGTLTFAPSEVEKLITISIIDSDLVETDERLLVNLSNLQAGTAAVSFADTHGVITILDDDQSNLRISDLTIQEDSGTAYVTVSLDKPLPTPVSIDFSTVGQSATQSVDFEQSTGTLTFAPGELTKVIPIVITNDNYTETTETLLINLSNLQTVSPDVILADWQSVVTIEDDDQAKVSVNSITVNESTGSAVVQVTLDHPVLTTITLDYATADDSALNASDYFSKSGTLTFFAGQQTKYVSIPILNDNLVEGNESFLFNLTNLQSNGYDVDFLSEQALITIQDNDQASISISDISVDENAGTALLTVELSKPVETAFTVNYATAEQSALGTLDFIATSGTLTFDSGEQSKTIAVSLVNTDLVESDETFLINLFDIQANGADITLANDQAVVRIQDDDQAQISIDDISVVESAGTAVITVSLDAPVDTAISVDFSTSDQTANHPDDYLAVSGTLIFNPGDLSQTITVAIVYSDHFEINETFQIDLENIQTTARDVTIADDQAVITIQDKVTTAGEIHFRVVNQPTSTSLTGEADTLPENESIISEWSTYWVEIWVELTSQVDHGVYSVSADFNYNTAYTSAAEIEFGEGFTQNQAGSINDLTGSLAGIYAETTINHLGADSPVLFARVRFSPGSEDQVSLETEPNSIGPYNLNFEITNSHVELGGNTPVTVNVDLSPGASIYANPFDLNDDDIINYRDLILLAGLYNTVPSESDSKFAWFSDFNQDDRINYRDLISLVGNYNKGKQDQTEVIYPQTYPNAWSDLLLVDTLSTPPVTADSVSQSDVVSTFDTVIDQTMNSPVLSSEQQKSLKHIDIQVIDLGGDILGAAAGSTIYIDVDAAGYGWFIDSTPTGYSEYTWSSELTLIALPDSDAADGIDLWTVIQHELGHLLDYEHSETGLMQETLVPGIRKLPEWELNYEYENPMEPEAVDPFFLNMRDETNLLPF